MGISVDAKLKDHPFVQALKRGLSDFQRAEKACYAWQIFAKESRGSQQLLILKDTQDPLQNIQTRSVEDFEVSYVLYSRHDHDGRIVQGEGRSVLDPFQELAPQIQSVFHASLEVGNPPWDLLPPPSEGRPHVQSADPTIVQNPGHVLQNIRQRVVGAIRNLRGVLVNSAEIFVTAHHHHQWSSTGLDIRDVRTDIYLETALEQAQKQNSQECHKFVTAVSAEQLDVDGFFQKCMVEAGLLKKAQIPSSDSQAVVLVHANVISTFLHMIIRQLDADKEYLGRPHVCPGDMVVEAANDRSDRLSVRLDPFLPWMANSRSCTPEGILSESALLIDEGRVCKQMVSHKMAQYLQRASNGICGNVVVDAGRVSYASLRRAAPKVIEVYEFASLLYNPDLLTWSSEIKLAVEYDNNKKEQRILKGGVISGSLRENFSDIQFSLETETHNVIGQSYLPTEGYLGPKAMLMRRGVNIAGKT